MINEHEKEVVMVVVKEKFLADRQKVKVRADLHFPEWVAIELWGDVGSKYDVADRHHNRVPFARGAVAMGCRV
jgi:hypothetical protein